MPDRRYREMDKAEIDRQLNLRARWPEHGAYFKRWASDSAAVRGRLEGHGEKQILDTAVFLMWHESYHMGQLGTIRTQFGLTPTATLAVEAGGI